MNIRKLTNADLLDAKRISATSFHGAVNPEEEIPPIDEKRAIRWGAFHENGALMGIITDNVMPMRFDGNTVLMSGIGGVATLPEFRYGNCIREIFREMLKEEYKRGVVFSTLYPFSHRFYGKFGYVLCNHSQYYRFPATSLRDFRFSGWAKAWNPGDPITPYTSLYNKWSEKFNISVPRDDDRMSHCFKGDPLQARINDKYAPRRFAYLLGTEETSQALAYVIFDDIKPFEGKPVLHVYESAWTGKAGFDCIIGFLSRFSADYGDIAFPSSSSIDLNAVLPDPYAIKTEIGSAFMGRAVNVQKALEKLKRPEETRLILGVEDDFLTENTGNYLITGKGVIRTERDADFRVNIRTLTPLMLGFYDLDTALLREGTEILGEEEILRKIFVRKPLFINDHF